MRGHAGLKQSVNVAPPPPQPALMARFHSDPTSPLADALRVPGGLFGEEAVARWWRGGAQLVIGGCAWGEGHGSGGFCLASPETISRAGRFVLTAKAPPEGFQSEKRS